MSLVQQAPLHPFPSISNGDYPNVDLDGGELISQEQVFDKNLEIHFRLQHEEVDSDGVRVIVYEFTIKLPDNSEVIKTIRKKVQLNMMQMSRQIRVTNGAGELYLLVNFVQTP